LSIKFPLRACAAAVAISVLSLTPAVALDIQRIWRHGASLFGDLKYPADFKHFDYVNPDAPKGGVVRLAAAGTFDNFNPVVNGVKGTLALTPLTETLVYSPLMTEALDEVASEYGLIAESVSYPEDYSSEMARRRAGDAGGRHLLVRFLEDHSSPLCCVLPACGKGREDRPA
jgi:microcin C transport system substrate-binding protein